MADKFFRVLLDLTGLQEQNFQYVWMNVSPRELKTISDFEKSILNKLNLKQNSIELFVRDGLLLDAETILVLREDDTVKVQYKKQHSNSNHCDDDFGKSCRKRNHSDSSIDTSPPHCKRHKSEPECLETNKNEEKQSRKKKNKKSQTYLDFQENHSVVLEESPATKVKNSKDKGKSSAKLDHDAHPRKDDSFFSFEVTEPLLKENEKIKHSSLKKNKTAFKKSTIVETDKLINSISASMLNENSHGSKEANKNKVSGEKLITGNSEEINLGIKSSGEQSGVLSKKKRKRRRKRKNKIESPVVILDKTSAECEFKSFSDSIDVKDKRKHIIYSSDPNETKEDSNSVSQLQSSSGTFTVKENNFASNNQSVFNYPKVSTPAQSDSCGNPSWSVSLMQSNKHSNDKISDSKTNLDENNEQLSQEKVTFSCFDDNNVSQNSNIDITHMSSSMQEKEHSLGESCFTQNNKFVKKNLSFHTERKSISSFLQNGSTSWDFSGDEKSIDKNFTSEKKHKTPDKNYKDFPKLNTTLPDKKHETPDKNYVDFPTMNTTLPDKKHETSDKNYEDFPALNTLPKVGTHIAYKTLELGEDYSPVISDYREGIVKSINPNTEELEIELTREIIKPGRIGKFENLKEDEIPSPDVITYDITQWSTIISAKCLS